MPSRATSGPSSNCRNPKSTPRQGCGPVPPLALSVPLWLVSLRSWLGGRLDLGGSEHVVSRRPENAAPLLIGL